MDQAPQAGQIPYPPAQATVAPVAQGDCVSRSPALADALWGRDSKLIQEELAHKAPDLFAAKVDQVEQWKSSEDGIEKRQLVADDLEAPIGHPQKARDVFYLIHQPHSYDRLHITKDTWTRLAIRHNVFHYFLETICAFGIKTEDDHNAWDNFHFRQLGGELETCYTVRFFERNSKLSASNDPWSLRQTGVYHRLHVEARTSTWILIKPSSYFKDRLSHKLHALWHHDESRLIRHILLHVMIFAFSLHGWRDYIATQRSRIEQFEDKSFFSEADKVDENDYSLSFEDRQNLQRIRRKLLRATSILDSAVQLGQRIRSTLVPHLVNGLLATHASQQILLELEDFSAELEYYKRCIADLLQRSSDVANLLSSILEHRLGNLHLRSTLANEASQGATACSLKIMTSIAVNNEMEHEIEKGVSISIRALTVVATLYLPASLLAGIFSSALVSHDSGHFIVSDEFWKFVVVLVPMVLVTVLIVLGLQYWWSKTYSDRLEQLRKETENGLPRLPLRGTARWWRELLCL